MDSASFEMTTPDQPIEVAPAPTIAELELSELELSELELSGLELSGLELSEPESLKLELSKPPGLSPTSSLKLSKHEIRTSLNASTWDGIFATIFSNITGGVLLTGFLMELGATPSQVGMLASIPLLANLVQPIGAYFSERTTSRRNFCFWIYGISRLLWVILAIAIGLLGWQSSDRHILIPLTLGIALMSGVLGALGSAPWLSWMAALVPRRLRGRYFGIRNSAANLTNLISIPLMGLVISKGFGGSLLGYGVVLMVGILAGGISLGFQHFKADVNPQLQRSQAAVSSQTPARSTPQWQTTNAWLFLLYFSGWMFASNLSTPFYNLYMLNNLALDIGQVTLYNSFTAGANLLMLMLWGKLADRVGNSTILLVVGVFVASTSLLWLMPGTNAVSIWFWLPLLHLLMGGAGAAIDLCNNNLQIGVAPLYNQSTYFGMVAAIAGVTSAVGAVAGGFLAQFWHYDGVLGLFVLSSVLRLSALLPLMFLREGGTITHRSWLPQKS